MQRRGKLLRWGSLATSIIDGLLGSRLAPKTFRGRLVIRNGNAGCSQTHQLCGNCLADVQGALHGPTLLLDLVLEKIDGVDELLWPRRAAGNIDIHWDHLVYALDQGVVVEDAARRSTGAHRDYPLGFGHLFPKLADNGCHLVGHAPGNNHEVGLPWRGAKDLRAESCNIETRRPPRHHFDA